LVAMRGAVGKMQRETEGNGNLMIEVAHPGNEVSESAQSWPENKVKDFARPSDVDEMLKNVNAHPDQKIAPWMTKAAEDAKGGFSVHPGTGVVPTTGKITSILPEKEVNLGHPATPEDVRDYRNENRQLFQDHPELHIGGYGNELNISAIGPNAEAVAKKLDQHSVYDLGEGKEILTGGANTIKNFPEYTLEQRLADLKGESIGSRANKSLLPRLPENEGIHGNVLDDIYHELGHTVVAKENGINTMDGIRSDRHPETQDSGGLAQVQMDFTPWGADENGNISFENARPHLTNILDALMGGGAAEEVLSGIPMNRNSGMGTDLHVAESMLRGLGYDEVEVAKHIQASKARAKEVLTRPGVADIMKKYAADREEGLPDEYHMSQAKIDQLLKEIKNEQNTGQGVERGTSDRNNRGLLRVAGGIVENVDAGTEGGSSQGIGQKTSDQISSRASKSGKEILNEAQGNRTSIARGTGTNGEISDANIEPGTTRIGKETNVGRDTASKTPENVESFNFGANVPGAAPGENTISTRFPSAARATENPVENHELKADAEALANTPGLPEKLAAKVKTYPGFITPADATPAQINEAFIRHVADNLKFVYDKTSPEDRAMSAQWYPVGAHNMTQEIAGDNGLTHAQAAGITAALSPQKDWDINVSLARRVANIFTKQQNTVTTPEMLAKLKEIASIPANKPMAKYAKLLAGKKFKDLDGDAQALWMRLYDEAHNSPSYEAWSPDGTSKGIKTNSTGDPGNVAWGSLSEILKTVKIMKDGSRENISRVMGKGHKIRSFFNNIIDPNSPRSDVTVDTHAVAAGLMRPLSGFDSAVQDNFGKAGKSSITGVSGTYPLFSDAYKLAAKELDIEHPNQLQSIVWEHIRKLFSSEFKTPESKAVIDSIWKEHTDEQITADEARERIYQYAQRRSRATDGPGGNPDNQGELSHDRVSGQSASATGGGGRGRASRAPKKANAIDFINALRKPISK